MNNTVPIEHGEFVGQAVEVPAMRVAGVPQWQPISTAPKDNKARLFWCPERQNIYALTWDEEGNGWRHFGGYGLLNDWDRPTHWMPLPAPPGAAPSPITDAPATQPEAEKADAVDAKSRPFGCALAMRVMQSGLYIRLDCVERAECDELVRRNLEWFKADAAIATVEKPHAE